MAQVRKKLEANIKLSKQEKGSNGWELKMRVLKH